MKVILMALKSIEINVSNVNSAKNSLLYHIMFVAPKQFFFDELIL